MASETGVKGTDTRPAVVGDFIGATEGPSALANATPPPSLLAGYGEYVKELGKVREELYKDYLKGLSDRD